MKLSYALLLAAAGTPLAASAQADQAAPPPYRSVFAGYQSMPETTRTPDQTWRQSNRDVATPGAGHTGHTGHMQHGKMEHGAGDHGKMHHGSHSPSQDSRTGPVKQPAATPASSAPPQHQHKEH